ncbi:hypothetical protein [Sorangium sp. So ce363]|uniref:hypothetical protein n=1 Tax=Sorangium sp. So ce363 TaxID=3133304 RepID=UPI003F5F6F11
MGGSSLDGIAGRPAPETGEKMRRSALARFLPQANVLLVRASGDQGVVCSLAQQTRLAMPALDASPSSPSHACAWRCASSTVATMR